MCYIITMKENMKPTIKRTELDTNNPDHWMSYGRWLMLTRKGAPKPEPTSFLWNDWAANNPTPEAHALGGFDFVKPMLASLTGISKGARPVECE